MANERDRVMRLLTAEQAALMRTENRLVKAVLADYAQVRRGLAADFAAVFDTLPDNPTDAQIRALANNATLIAAIDRRMIELNTLLNQTIDPVINDIAYSAFNAAKAEVDILAAGLGISVFFFEVDPLIDLVVQSVIEQIPLEVESFRLLLISELRQGLIAGESTQEISKRLFSTVPVDGRVSVSRRGEVSAELMTRRGVIQANTNSKLIAYSEAKKQIPELQKQAVASINAQTTQTCLRVHGQIRDIGEPFTLTGDPRFARNMQGSPFHWNCRTDVVAYVEAFDQGSNVTTADMRAAARQEAESR